MEKTLHARAPQRGLFTAVAVMVSVIAVVATLMVTPKAAALEIDAPTGPDVASWQHPSEAAINWNQVKSNGHDFAFVKATEGVKYINRHFIGDSNAAKAAGLIVGSYHYARPNLDPILQAKLYAATLATQPQPSLPPALDLEETGGLNPDQLIAWTRSFLDEIEKLTGRHPIIYTYRHFWLYKMNNDTTFTDYPLWLAAFQDEPPTDIPGGWDYMTIWQKTSKANIPGIANNVDLNVFNGSNEALQGFVAGTNVKLGNVLTDGVSIPGLVKTVAQVDGLGESNQKLAGIILGIGAGVLTVGAILGFARQHGIDLGPANEIVDHVSHLIDSGQLPMGDLKLMATEGKSTIGDLLILLRNADQLIGAVHQVTAAN